MLRALIADDEIMICELIRRLVDWDAFGIEVIGQVYDGRSALDCIRREQPDIVITDIRMPPFDGIELIRQVREAGLETRFIVVSGHRQFDYARSALKYDVTDYLLKPINREELQAALTKIAADLLELRQEQSDREQLESRLSADTRKLRKQFLYDLLEGRFHPEGMDLAAFNAAYRYQLTDGPLGLFVIKADCRDEHDLPLMPLVFERVLPIARRALLATCSCAETARADSRLYCFFQTSAEGRAALPGVYRTIADEFEGVLSDYESFSLTVCPTRPVEHLAALPEAVREAERSVCYRIVQTRLRISQYLETAPRPLRLDTVFSPSQQNVFLSVLRTGERAKIEAELRKLFRPFADHLFDAADPLMLYELCRLVLTLSRTHPDCAALDFSGALWAVDHAVSVPMLIDGFIGRTLDAMQPYFNGIIAQNIRPVQLAIEYIEQHYGEPLSLESVADHVHLTAPYFSMLFKKETGSTFIDYLTLQRMNHAKQLLRHSEYSVSEIAERTGYSDSKYFSRVFAKSFGISPQKYRKL